MEGTVISLDRSREIYEKVSKLVPGGVHSNVRYFEPHPIYFSKAEGSHIWDVDGNEYIDCIVNYGACILGHGHPRVKEAVMNQIQNGLTCGVETELSVEVAQKVVDMVPCADMVKFCCSGTEAVMHSLMIARGYTGRDKIIKIEGCYHGWYDPVMISVNPKLELAGSKSAPTPILESSGIPEEVLKNTIVIPFNNEEVAEKIVRKYRKKVAALIIEPVAFNMGVVLPKEGYLRALREITRDNDILLVFDEIITGFRLAPGGAQQYYAVTPDLAVFGKAIANGFPLSAVVGKEDIMEVVEPGGKVCYGGTYNGSQSSLAAASATLDILNEGHVQKYLNESTGKMIKDFAEITNDLNVQAMMQGLGGQFAIFFTDNEVIDYRGTAMTDKERRLMVAFQRGLLSRGILVSPRMGLGHYGISAAHTKEDLEIILNAMRRALSEIFINATHK